MAKRRKVTFRTNKGKMSFFVKEKSDKAVFVDKSGRKWSKGALQDMIDTLESLNEALEKLSYYKR